MSPQGARSIVLLSGGLDSATNLALCAEHDQPVLAITLDYGQQAARREVEAARRLAEYYAVPHRALEIPWLGALGGSALTDQSIPLPELKRSELDDAGTTQESARAVWVPNRNGLFLQVAGAWAEHLNCTRVVVGFNREEAATFPDNSEAFLDATSAAFRYSTRGGTVQAFSYTVRWNKREMVQALRQLGRPFPFEQVWSCYRGGEQPCGQCESCQRQARALDPEGGTA
jgi:7-cyano-7-deazaguanine synthase